jgi:hypothetical protein
VLFQGGEFAVVRGLVQDFLVVGRVVVLLGLSQGGVSLDLHVEKLTHLLLHLVFHLESELLTALELF